MRRTPLLLFGAPLLALLALLAVASLWLLSPTPPSAPDRELPALPGRAPAPPAFPLSAQPAQTLETRDAAPEATVAEDDDLETLRGVVLGPGGAPVPEAQVRLMQRRETAPGGDLVAMFSAAHAGRDTIAETVTDSTGAFQFSPDVPPYGDLVASIVGLAEGSRPCDGYGPWLLELAQSADVRGTVEDHSGRPLAGVHLSLLAFDFARLKPVQTLETRSAADGSFCFRAGPRPEGWVLWARTSDGRTAALDHILPPASALRVRFAQPGGLRGRVSTGAWDEAVVARLLLLGPAGVVVTETDAEGRYALPALSSGTWQLHLRAANRSIDREIHVLPGQETVFDLRLEEAVALDLTILDGTTGAPVAEARVAVVSRADGSASRQDGISDARGRLALRSFAPGTCVIHVLAAGRAPLVFAHPEPFAPGEQASLSLTLLEPATLRGTLRDRSGRPLAGLRVSWVDAGWQGLGFEHPPSAPSAADGSFELGGLSPGVTLELQCEDSPQRFLVEALEPGEVREGHDLAVDP